MVGSAGDLYASVQKLDGSYVLPGANIDALLRPAVPSPAAAPNISLLRLPNPSPAFFRCGHCHSPGYATERALKVKMSTTTAAAMSMKLLVDTKAGRVLFAEAGKDVVDFLFSLLALPVGTAVKLLGPDSMVGGAGDLYASVQKLDGSYVLPGANTDALLCPAVPSPAAAPSISLSLLGLPSPSPAFFRCGYCHSPGYVTEVRGAKCPRCGSHMADAIQCVRPDSGDSGQAAAGGARGFVQGVVTYTVMDNLAVTPMSAISSITLLNTFAVRGLGALQEMTVRIGYKEGLAILKAALQSKTVLTDVFLAGCKTGPVYD
ncbi:uncharacterized protein LOC119271914 [Triticum dicoccoides]|uniref:uncharacterized protein LOC119271914 n=1 Tax=Triticum dicoccoides TaxID=85692 RepID=UPI00188EA2BB|nr:uncharacterized protein LOC119271914 [Triticum dicoccoides]